MEEKVIKQIKTSCPFPLLIYKTRIRYNEVRKASGIAYILLELIQKEQSEERMSGVLLKFGIPAELHYIFGRELARLKDAGIIESAYSVSHFTNPDYFAEMKINEITLTAKGTKMFREGAIPTGEERFKDKDIFFSPVTRKFDIQSNLCYSPIGSCCLGDNFLDRVNIDISGMEDYLARNTQKIGLKAEERIVRFEPGEPLKMNSCAEDNMTIKIYRNDMEFSFNTTDEQAFFNRYYNAEIMTANMLLKDEYKFAGDNSAPVGLPAVKLISLEDISGLYIPADFTAQAKKPCKVFLHRGRVAFNRTDGAICCGKKLSAVLLDLIDKNSEFALLDLFKGKYYSPLNVAMPCRNFGGTFKLNLLTENIIPEDIYKKLIIRLYAEYAAAEADRTAAEVIQYVVDSLKSPDYFGEYIDLKLKPVSAVDEKIAVLLKLNGLFGKHAKWEEYFVPVAKELFDKSVRPIKIDNVIYKNTVLTPLKTELHMSNAEYIRRFSQSLRETENPVIVYEALQSAGFSSMEILGVVNVVERFMRTALDNGTILSETPLAVQFKTLQTNLWKLNDMLGIESFTGYTLREDFNVDEFFNAYSTLTGALKAVEKYRQFARKEFDECGMYTAIYAPIHELLSIERTSSSHPEKITKKYVDELIARGKYKEAICDLLVKLQYDLREVLKADKGAETKDLIDKARDTKLIDRDTADSLHQLRICRNRFQHPDDSKARIQFEKTTVNGWKEIVFSVKENKQ